MALVSGSIPNVINGVSQQPPSLRLPTQATTQTNGYSSVVKGLSKRPPTEHVAYVTGLPVAQASDYQTAFFHTMRLQDSDGVSRPYFVVIGANGVKVYNNAGVTQTVTDNTSGYGYFSGITDFSSQVKATTVADYTFILNNQKKVKKGTSTSAALKHEAMVWVKQGDYSTTYTLELTYSGTTYSSSYSTRDSGDVAHEVDAKTTNIASQLKTGIDTALSNASITGFTTELLDNIIYITRSDNAVFEINTTDSYGDTHLKGIKGVVSDLKDLPSQGKAGFVVRVNGDTTKGQDDYFVKLQQTDVASDYVWKETVGPSVALNFDATTMPHRLTRQANGTFVFDVVSWDDRNSGDDDTNPYPTFSNYDASTYPNGQHTINDVFFYKNRLCFLSDENLICSQTSKYFNFWQTTILTLLDDAPIDVAVSNNTVSILKHGIPFNESLILFSDLTQFKVTNTDIFSLSTVSVNVTTNFEASLRAAPTAAGKFVFFSTLKGVYSGVREYFVDTDNDTNDATDITAHVPEYLEGEVTQLLASSNEDIMLVRSASRKQSIYIYSYYWGGQEKLQSSWSEWTFGNNVLFVAMDNSKIYLLVERAEGVAIETLNLSDDGALADTNTFGINLDRRFRRASSSDTSPYTGGTNVKTDGTILTDSQATTALAASEVVYTGVPYTFTYEFSPIVIKQEDRPITQGRVQIKNMNVVYADTGSFEVSVKRPTDSAATVKLFTGHELGEGSSGVLPIVSGSFRFPVLSEASNVSVKLQSSTFHPAKFQSAEWEGTFHLRNRRI